MLPVRGAVCTDLPGVVMTSNAGCLGIIACDSGVQSTAMPVATGSYLEMHLTHLTKAAEHLAHAGLAEEAASVSVLANQLRMESIATKHAQIAALQAEIAALQTDSDAVCRVIRVAVRIVDELTDLIGSLSQRDRRAGRLENDFDWERRTFFR